MKTYNNIRKFFTYSFLIISTIILSVSCGSDSDEDLQPYQKKIKDKPIIEGVYTARGQVQINQGVLENMINIKGNNLASLKSIHFNGYQAYVNPTFVTDTNIFVVIPEDAPFISNINKIRLETLGGVTEYDFPLLTITSFETGNDGTGDTVTLFGGDFTYANEVVFSRGSEDEGTLVENVAQIISQTATEIKVYVPEGTTQAYINVNTSLGASARSESYGFNYPFYVESLNSDWWLAGWGSPDETDAAYADIAKGAFSIKRTMGQWNGLMFGTDGSGVPLDEYESITFEIYGGENAAKLRLSINGLNNDDIGKVLELKAGEWKKFEIQLNDSELNPPSNYQTEIKEIVFQEFGGEAISEMTFYLDNFGLL